MKKVAIIGPCGEGPEYITGQGVKTLATVKWMRRRFGEDSVITVNTRGWKRHPFRMVFSVIRAVRCAQNILLLPAQHGIRVFPRLLVLANRFFRRRLFLLVIGGWLADHVRQSPSLKRVLSRFDGVCAETESLASRLRDAGLPRAWYLPNFRDSVPGDLYERSMVPPLRVCTFSRVTETKGIRDAVEICRRANATLGSTVFLLDIYGPVDSGFAREFEELCRQEADMVRYCGVCGVDEAGTVLREHFALLFPTYYEGECFAGTALDAFLWHLPILASDWKYNHEVIHDGVNGFLFPARDTARAAGLLVRLSRDRELYLSIQDGCRKSAEVYSSDRVLEKLVKEMV